MAMQRISAVAIGSAILALAPAFVPSAHGIDTARAQQTVAAEPATAEPATPEPAMPDAALAESPAEPGALLANPRDLSPEDEAALRKAFSIDIRELDSERRARINRSGNSDTARANWTRDQGKDGAATVKVQRALATEWDAKIGADVGLAPTPPSIVPPESLLTGPNKDAGSGAAWASIAVPNVAAFDARVNPTQDQSALGATFRQALPFGQDYALTLQNRYGVIDTLGTTTLAGTPATPGRIYTTDREVKLNVLSSKTAVSAGTSSNTADNLTRARIKAEQQLYGPLSLSASVSDIGAPVTNKTVKAGFTLGW